MILNILKKVVNRVIRPKSVFEMGSEKMRLYMGGFDEPKDDIDRSFFQYRCQMQQCSILACLLLNCASAFFLLFYLIRLKKSDPNTNGKPGVAVFYSNGLNPNILPKSLWRDYDDIEVIEEENPKTIDKIGIDVIKQIIKKHPFSYYFIVKNLIKLSIYSSLIENFKCKTIVCSCEYSFTSSILTYYCNSKNVKHINIMHGEKLFSIRDSFFHFNVFYIWDEYYCQLFEDLRAASDSYIVEIPEIFYFKIKSECKIDYKYYLQAESIKELKHIYSSMMCLKNNGYSVKVRLHPMYSDRKAVKHIFQNIEIEDHSEISIEDSIAETRTVISLYSTVLFQAYLNGVNIIVDDITNVDKYNELSNLGYIIVKLNHERLSSLMLKK